MTGQQIEHEGYIYRYIVTQFPDEGPEYMERMDIARTQKGWERLPEDYPIPQEVMEHFFGPIIDDD